MPTYEDVKIIKKRYKFRPKLLLNLRKKSMMTDEKMNASELRSTSANSFRSGGIIKVQKCIDKKIMSVSVRRKVSISSKASSEVQTEAEEEETEKLEMFADFPINERDINEEESPIRKK